MGSGLLEMHEVLDYHKKYSLFENTLDTCVDIHTFFWNELLEKQPEIMKLHNFGNEIMKMVDEVAIMFNDLTALDSDNVKCLTVYANFVKYVRNDEIAAQSLFEK